MVDWNMTESMRRRLLLRVVLLLTTWFFGHTAAWLNKASVNRNNRVSLSTIFATPIHPTTNTNTRQQHVIDIQQHVGSGSYGTVYLCHYTDAQGNLQRGIAKRAWTCDELALQHSTITQKQQQQQQQLVDKATRAQYYLSVEQHCLTKLQKEDKSSNSKVTPTFIGRFKDSTNSHEWIVMTLITTNTSSQTVAKTLKQVMDNDWMDQHAPTHPPSYHHLLQIQQELNLSPLATFQDILDTILLQLITCIQSIHSMNLVHRDVKPENLLIDGTRQSLVLIDFGSAADLEPISTSPFGWKKRMGLEDDSIVALSPIYSAPEQFIKVDRNPLQFDVFSIAMIFCQLLFNLLDERTDAAFRQQLSESNYDLDTWLARELSSTIRPVGLDDALSYLVERKGLWSLLQDMIRPDPMDRISSAQAYKRFNAILCSSDSSDDNFLDLIRSSMETCTLSDESLIDGIDPMTSHHTTSRPLHFVASFDRSEPLGLLLSEALDKSPSMDLDGEDSAWKIATENASHGDVFIQGLVENGQASQIGVFQIGDRVRAVGDIPVLGIGFEGFLRVLGSYPKSAKTLTIHFDRKLSASSDQHLIRRDKSVRYVGHGAWSSKGRRIAQEDTFILHEIHDYDGLPKVLLAGVFDGHGGIAAAKTAAQVLPALFATELQDGLRDLSKGLNSAWDKTCETYREGCNILGSCIAEYDPREGIILAENGSKDLVSGTTASVVAMDFRSDEITVLNCGDSRTIILTDVPAKPNTIFYRPSHVHFATRDHSPSDENEIMRLRAGKDNGFDYAEPECSLSRHYLTVGDYQYAVSRSLEGTMATSKGIISDADVTKLNISQIVPGGTGTVNGAIVIGTDGLFDLMSDEEVAGQIVNMMKTGIPADDASKELCHRALKKGSSDNISIIVIYFSL